MHFPTANMGGVQLAYTRYWIKVGVAYMEHIHFHPHLTHMHYQEEEGQTSNTFFGNVTISLPVEIQTHAFFFFYDVAANPTC